MALRRGSLASLVTFSALALLGTGAGGGKVSAADVAPYTGLGTWISIYSPSFKTNPARLAAVLAQRGVQTLFVQTGNFRQRVDIVRATQLGRLIEAAHEQGIAVVGWYLPDFANTARDLRRARAAINFRTTGGDRFDAFALDIESSIVRTTTLRNR